MIKAVIFDCFGVIRIDATSIAYEKLGGDIEADREWLRDLIVKANSGQVINSGDMVAQRLGTTKEVWRETVQNSSVIDEKVLNYACSLRPKYKVAMLSNIGQGGLKRWFEEGYLDKYFDVVVGSGDIGFAKPEPEAYEVTADRLGVRLSECVMIDDRQEYCEGAEAVGMKSIVYSSFEQMKKALEVILTGSGADN